MSISISPDQLEYSQSLKDEFTREVEANLRDFERSYCFPGRYLPWWKQLLPWQTPVKAVSDREEGYGSVYLFDLTNAWRRKLVVLGLCDSEDDALARCNCFRVFELSNGYLRVLFAEVFLTVPPSGAYSAESVSCEPQFLVPQAEKLLLDFAAKRSVAGIVVAFASAGTFEETLHSSSEDEIVRLFFSCAQGENSAEDWVCRLPEGTGSLVWQGFLRHLLPAGKEWRLKRLRENIEEILAMPDRGNATVRKLAEMLGLPSGIILLDAEQLVANGEYEWRNISGDDLALEKPLSGASSFLGKRCCFTRQFGSSVKKSGFALCFVAVGFGFLSWLGSGGEWLWQVWGLFALGWYVQGLSKARKLRTTGVRVK